MRGLAVGASQLCGLWRGGKGWFFTVEDWAAEGSARKRLEGGCSRAFVFHFFLTGGSGFSRRSRHFLFRLLLPSKSTR